MPNLGVGELVVVLLIVVVVFGSTKLPQLGDGLGRAIKNFKRAVGGANEIEVTPKKELKGDDAEPAGKPSAKDESPVKSTP
jgi:sec-independent protein translocase protein TatA